LLYHAIVSITLDYLHLHLIPYIGYPLLYNNWITYIWLSTLYPSLQYPHNCIPYIWLPTFTFDFLLVDIHCYIHYIWFHYIVSHNCIPYIWFPPCGYPLLYPHNCIHYIWFPTFDYIHCIIYIYIKYHLLYHPHCITQLDSLHWIIYIGLSTLDYLHCITCCIHYIWLSTFDSLPGIPCIVFPILDNPCCIIYIVSIPSLWITYIWLLTLDYLHWISLAVSITLDYLHCIIYVISLAVSHNCIHYIVYLTFDSLIAVSPTLYHTIVSTTLYPSLWISLTVSITLYPLHLIIYIWLPTVYPLHCIT